MTKHAAKKLTSSAVTAEEQKFAASAMGMSNGGSSKARGPPKSASELEVVDDALEAVRLNWPAFTVITQAEGKKWPETEPQMDDPVFAFITWRKRVSFSGVTKRVEYGLKERNHVRRGLVRNLKAAIKTYTLRRFGET